MTHAPYSARGKLVVFPCCGLCNRIQVMACATLLAADTGRDLHVNWFPRHDCGAGFNDIFLSEATLFETVPDDASCYSSVQRHPAVAPERYASLLGSCAKERFAGIKQDSSPTLVIFSCHQFLGYFHDARFPSTVRELCRQVRPEITQVVDEFRERFFAPTTIGVHIRRGDWRSQQNLDYYFDFMRQFQNVGFFVSTDEPDVFASVQKQFPAAVRYEASSLHRGQPAAVRDAMIDVLLLAGTSYLIGTPGSSFSAMAQTIGDIPGTFDYGYSLSKRDFKLGNLDNIGRVMWGRWKRRLRSKPNPRGSG